MAAADVSYFLSPLPPDGDLRFICAWPAQGIAESVTVISAESILEAAAAPRSFGPCNQSRPPYPAPSLPVLPEGGWFARNAATPED